MSKKARRIAHLKRRKAAAGPKITPAKNPLASNGIGQLVSLKTRAREKNRAAAEAREHILPGVADLIASLDPIARNAVSDYLDNRDALVRKAAAGDGFALAGSFDEPFTSWLPVEEIADAPKQGQAEQAAPAAPVAEALGDAPERVGPRPLPELRDSGNAGA